LVQKLRTEIVVSPCIQDNYRTQFSIRRSKEQGIFTLVSGISFPDTNRISNKRPDISLRLCALPPSAIPLISEDAMAERLSRKELYDLVWSEPLKTLCSRFGISDVALKKTCARSKIPTPERGYWAKKDAGKPTLQVALPIRPPGMDDQVLIAAGQSYWYQNWKKEELLCPLPPCPSLRETCLLEHMFQALAPSFADHSKLGTRP